MPIPVVSPRSPVTATAAQSIAVTARLGPVPIVRDRMLAHTATTVATRRADPALAIVLLCDRLRRRHAEAPVWLRFAGRPHLLLIHRDDVRAAVDGRPAGFTSETPISHSRRRTVEADRRPDRSWRHRFDTAARVAATDPRTGLAAIAHTTALLSHGDRITLAAWRTLHRRVLRHVLLGAGAAGDDTLPTAGADRILDRVAGADAEPVPALLEVSTRTAVPLVRTITRLADILAANSFRTLQLLSVRPPVCPGPMYAAACLRETARLWPTDLTLVRETRRETWWGSAIVPAGTRLMVVNQFGHRDRRRLAHADEYMPGEWLYGGHAVREPLFNGFGHRRGPDPVQDLALACGAVVLSTVTEASILLPTAGALYPDGRVRHSPPPSPVVRLRPRGPARPVLPRIPVSQRRALPLASP